MKKAYETPYIEIVKFDITDPDILTAGGGFDSNIGGGEAGDGTWTLNEF